MTDLVRKLSMKKTFFVTQLESFFSSITHEFQEKLNSLEIENKLLKERNEKLEYDVKNLVKIKNELLEKIKYQQESFEILNTKLYESKSQDDNTKSNIDLIEENNKLKKEIEKIREDLKNIQKKPISSSAILNRGNAAYNQNMMQKKNEEILKEIAKSLKK